MGQIREYLSQNAADGLPPTGRASPEDFGGAAATGASNLGAGLQAYGQGLEVHQANQEVDRAYNDNAKARAALEKDYFARASKAQPGDMAFADSFAADAKKYLDDNSQGYETPHGQRVSQRLNSELLGSMSIKALAFQQQLAGAGAVQSAKETAQADGVVLLHDPAQYDSLKALRTQQIMEGQGKYANLNELQKIEQKDAMVKTMALAATEAQALGNPSRFLAATDEKRIKDGKSGVAPFDDLNFEEQIAVRRMAETKEDQNVAVNRAALSDRVRDANAAYLSGQDFPNPPAKGDFFASYPHKMWGEAERAWNDFQTTQQFGQMFKAVPGMVNEKQDALLQANKPVPGPGFANAEIRYDALVKMVDRSRTARMQAPLDTAQQYNMAPVPDLKTDTPENFANSLKARIPAAVAMNSTFGSPLEFFKKDEATPVKEWLLAKSVPEQLVFFGAARVALKDDDQFKGFVSQVAEDSPVTGVAAEIYGKKPQGLVSHFFSGDTAYQPPVDPGTVAETMLTGQHLLNGKFTDKDATGAGKQFPMPSAEGVTGTNQLFARTVGDAFAGNPGRAKIMFNAVTSYYAGASAKAGDVSGTLNTARFKDAVNAVVGEPVPWASSKVLPPWGMSPDTFKDRLTSNGFKALQDGGWSGYDANPTRYRAVQAGDKYMFMSEAGPILDSKRQPILVDVTK